MNKAISRSKWVSDNIIYTLYSLHNKNWNTRLLSSNSKSSSSNELETETIPNIPNTPQLPERPPGDNTKSRYEIDLLKDINETEKNQLHELAKTNLDSPSPPLSPPSSSSNIYTNSSITSDTPKKKGRLSFFDQVIADHVEAVSDRRKELELNGGTSR